MRVKFNVTDEFLGELEMDRDAVERKVVRVTCRFSRNEMYTGVSVIATAVVGPHVVELSARCGEYLSEDHDGKPVRQRADLESSKLRTRLHELGFDVRAGSFEAP
jgi:hypothetical protein